MKKTLSIILKYLTQPFLHFFITVAGVFFILYFEHVMHSKNDRKFDELKNILWVFIVLSVLFLCIAIVAIISGYQEREAEEKKIELSRLETEKEILISNNKITQLEIERSNNHPVVVNFEQNNEYDSSTRKFKDRAYDLSLKEVSKAQKYILIVADYSPPNEPLRATDSRQNYYDTILRVLEEKLKKDTTGMPLKYVRYMQRPDEIYKKIRASDGHINEDNMIKGDEQAFAHCKKILSLRAENRQKVEILIYVTPIIPSLPSILIVDDNKLLFTIPRRTVTTSEEVKKRLEPVETAGVMIFEDKSNGGKVLVQPFKDIVSSLCSDGETNTAEVQIVKSVSNFKDNSEFQNWYTHKSNT